MTDTMTMQHQGHVPGDARPVASTVVRPWPTPGFLGCGTDVVGIATGGYLGTTVATADATGPNTGTPTTRHLRTRST